MTPDKQLIKKIKEGDVEAFDALYHCYSNKLYHFIYGLVKNQDLAKDLLQEVFLNLWEKREQVDLNLSFDNYIFTITYNAVRKYFRKKSVELRAVDHLLRNSPEYLEDVEGTIIYSELLELANKTIENLPPQRKIVYKLSKQEGMKLKEIAGKLDISPRTAENHLAKALKYLKEELSMISFHAFLFFHLFLN